MEEPGYLLRAVMWHFGSGDAFFMGWALVLIAVVVRARGARTSRVVLIGLLAFVWLALADPLSFTAACCIALMILANVILRWRLPAWRSREYFIRPLIGSVAVLAFCLELSYHLPINPRASEAESVAIIGDSVTAGLNASDHTWPRRLVEVTGRTVYDASQQGATVKSALEQLDRLAGRGDVLWIEIGGNDILESLPVALYSERLEHLLQSARERYSTIVLMEIPAPPGGGGYGYEQRRLASKYRIPLVPKRQFLAVLTSRGGTQDGVHLADGGHRHMATIVEQTLGWHHSDAGTRNGDYARCE